MRKIIVFSMVSIDGVMQAPGGPDEDTSGGFKLGGWTAAYSDEAFMKIMMEELKPAEYILGRKTFEIFEAYWPNHADFWPGINDGKKNILSTTRDRSDWKHTEFLKNISAIEKLKNTEGGDLHVWGSSELVALLLEHELVDELRLKVYPVLLGKGKKLFTDNAIPSAFTLADHVVTSKGVVIGTYKREGKIATANVEI